MPYLNWRAAPVQQSMQRDELGKNGQLVLKIPAHLMEELLAELELTFLKAEGELRVQLPQEWILFWKLRDGESRLLLAHPRAEEWVGTAALEEEHGRTLIEKLREALGRSGTESAVRVGPLGRTSSISNLEIQLEIAQAGSAP